MRTDVVTTLPAAPGAHHGRPDFAIARRAFRQVRIGAVVCAVAFGATVASTALGYLATYPSEASRQQAAATVGGDTGLAVLLGPVANVGTVGGYTVYKVFVLLTTVGAIWAVIAATRVLRGEEDAGRWQLVLAGSTRASRATAATLAALGVAVGMIFVGTTALTLWAGRDPDIGFGTRDTVLYGLSIALIPAVFAAVGALTSQLTRTRRAATGLGIACFALTFLVRMIADSGPDTRWLLWATPFGWTERMHPFTENNAWPLLPAALTVLVLCAATIVLASRRDAGDGVLASRDVARVRPFGLDSAFGLAVRLELPVLTAWFAGAVATGLTLGIIAKVTTETTNLPASLEDFLDKFNVQGSFANRFLGLGFVFVATVVALLPASQVGAACAEETSGRLVHTLSRPTRRTTWLVGRLAVAAAAIVVAALLAGLGIWLGAKSQGVGLDLATMLGAGLNVVPTALVVLGVGAVVLAVAPRAAATSVYLMVLWSTLADIVAPVFPGMNWLGKLSLFHYMTLVPGHDPDLKALAITTTVALVLGAAATALFARRDIRAV